MRQGGHGEVTRRSREELPKARLMFVEALISVMLVSPLLSRKQRVNAASPAAELG